ncbi:hypothetical protein [Nocardia mangyaensis]|uniref:hypothetical protein n=1 Tax=Nocardia mangyaensis TaxID=2213200 RepID=UPI0026772E7A|nr:hypothetical protein [Nocardia mangyaensis]MDO3650126.1 hypothetical protein [Nocardia mangyaensis]
MRDVFDPLADIDRVLAEQAGWTWFDDYLLYTCGVADLISTDRVAQIPSKPTRVRVEAGEVCLADGPVNWFTWRAGGDGRYARGQVRADGRTAIGAVHHLGNAVRNEARRLRAEAAAQPRWVAERAGTAMISDRRMHLTAPDRAFSLYWSALEGIDLTAPDRIGCRFPDKQGTIQQLQVQSPWAPLLFVTAALRHFPQHPLLQNGTWLPAGFEEKCHLAGKKCPRVRKLG